MRLPTRRGETVCPPCALLYSRFALRCVVLANPESGVVGADIGRHLTMRRRIPARSCRFAARDGNLLEIGAHNFQVGKDRQADDPAFWNSCRPP